MVHRRAVARILLAMCFCAVGHCSRIASSPEHKKEQGVCTIAHPATGLKIDVPMWSGNQVVCKRLLYEDGSSIGPASAAFEAMEAPRVWSATTHSFSAPRCQCSFEAGLRFRKHVLSLPKPYLSQGSCTRMSCWLAYRMIQSKGKRGKASMARVNSFEATFRPCSPLGSPECEPKINLPRPPMLEEVKKMDIAEHERKELEQIATDMIVAPLKEEDEAYYYHWQEEDAGTPSNSSDTLELSPTHEGKGSQASSETASQKEEAKEEDELKSVLDSIDEEDEEEGAVAGEEPVPENISAGDDEDSAAPSEEQSESGGDLSATTQDATKEGGNVSEPSSANISPAGEESEEGEEVNLLAENTSEDNEEDAPAEEDDSSSATTEETETGEETTPHDGDTGGEDVSTSPENPSDGDIGGEDVSTSPANTSEGEDEDVAAEEDETSSTTMVEGEDGEGDASEYGVAKGEEEVTSSSESSSDDEGEDGEGGNDEDEEGDTSEYGVAKGEEEVTSSSDSTSEDQGEGGEGGEGSTDEVPDAKLDESQPCVVEYVATDPCSYDREARKWQQPKEPVVVRPGGSSAPPCPSEVVLEPCNPPALTEADACQGLNRTECLSREEKCTWHGKWLFGVFGGFCYDPEISEPGLKAPEKQLLDFGDAPLSLMIDQKWDNITCFSLTSDPATCDLHPRCDMENEGTENQTCAVHPIFLSDLLDPIDNCYLDTLSEASLFAVVMDLANEGKVPAQALAEIKDPDVDVCDVIEQFFLFRKTKYSARKDEAPAWAKGLVMVLMASEVGKVLTMPMMGVHNVMQQPAAPSPGGALAPVHVNPALPASPAVPPPGSALAPVYVNPALPASPAVPAEPAAVPAVPAVHTEPAAPVEPAPSSTSGGGAGGSWEEDAPSGTFGDQFKGYARKHEKEWDAERLRKIRWARKMALFN